MAANPILDFGAIAQPVYRGTEATGPDARQVSRQDESHALLYPVEPCEVSESSGPLQTSNQSASAARLPIAVSIIQTQIDSLPASDDIEARPTSYALAEARRVILGAYAEVFSKNLSESSKRPPKPVLGTDDAGGILISWTAGPRYLAAKFAPGPELNSFVYFEQGATHQALDLSEQNLLEKLRWLSE